MPYEASEGSSRELTPSSPLHLVGFDNWLGNTLITQFGIACG